MAFPADRHAISPGPLVHQPDPVPLELENVLHLDAIVFEEFARIVVTECRQDRRDSFQLIENRHPEDIAAVQDEVDPPEDLEHLRRDVQCDARDMGVGYQPDSQ